MRSVQTRMPAGSVAGSVAEAFACCWQWGHRGCALHREGVCHPERPAGMPLTGLVTATRGVVCKGLSWCTQREISKMPSYS